METAVSWQVDVEENQIWPGMTLRFDAVERFDGSLPFLDNVDAVRQGGFAEDEAHQRNIRGIIFNKQNTETGRCRAGAGLLGLKSRCQLLASG